MAKKDNYKPSEAFVAYQKFIVNHPAYADMPDAYCDDGRIQWETPSNRKSGKHKDTHDKRRMWWKKKAAEVGISTSESEWISKVAKKIHPTKLHPCKKCGCFVDVRNLYLSKNLLSRLTKLGYDRNKLKATETESILDLVKSAYKIYGERILSDISALLKCKAVPRIPDFNGLDDCLKWIEDFYSQQKTKLLGPGVMANPPDRFDGFHSFNRCCRDTADKGRSKKNLASYATDRRAFEFWSDGNWVAANKLMGLIRTNSTLSHLECHCRGDGHDHPTPCAADHIGPISLGFAHRPEFQMLCNSCNSAKNNRMFLSDVQHLIRREAEGECVVSWYAKTVWDELKNLVDTQDKALRLSRVMRDNRFNALLSLGQFMNTDGYLFLFYLLDLSYADFDYTVESTSVEGDYVTATFSNKMRTTKYRLEQKARKVRVAFESLRDYLTKKRRNGAAFSTLQTEAVMQKAKAKAKAFATQHKDLTNSLARIVKRKKNTEDSLRTLIRQMPDLHDDANFLAAKKALVKFMDLTGRGLAANWMSDRYCRDLDYDKEFGA